MNQFVKFGHGTSNTLPAGVPNGYLKAVFFDKAGNVQVAESQVKYLQTSVNNWQTLELSFTASQNGLQVYVANESDQEVFFDELEVAHTPTLIAQENHYYPYGMNMVGIEKQGMPHHRFQYNAQTERETAFHLHWDETSFRRYDAQIGRFHGVDALASSYAGITPYQYGFNNPVMFNDPSGLKPTPGVGDGSSLGVTDRMFGDFLGGSSFSNRGISATGDGWQRRQEQDEFARTLNPWDYTTNVTNIVKSKAFRGFDENANVLFQMASIVGGYDGGEDLPELRLRLVTIYTHANLDKMRIERGISQMKQAIYDGQGRFINRSFEYLSIASAISDVAGIGGLVKAGGKFLARQAIKRFGRRSSKWVIPKGPGAQGVNPVVVEDDIVRVRHHTSKRALKGIRGSKQINPSRGEPYGVDVEVSPFVKPSKARFGQFGKGAYVEFSVPRSQLGKIPAGYMGAESGTGARIVTGLNPLDISNLSPTFKVWKWWAF